MALSIFPTGTTIKFGVTGITGQLVQSADLTKKFNINQKIKDETGKNAVHLLDDRFTEISVTFSFKGTAIADIGDTFAYDFADGSVTYILTEIMQKRKNDTNMAVTYKAEKSEGIAYAGA